MPARRVEARVGVSAKAELRVVRQGPANGRRSQQPRKPSRPGHSWGFAAGSGKLQLIRQWSAVPRL